jgi:hypothetical protein
VRLERRRGLNERSPRRITAEAGEPCLGHTPLSYRSVPTEYSRHGRRCTIEECESVRYVEVRAPRPGTQAAAPPKDQVRSGCTQSSLRRPPERVWERPSIGTSTDPDKSLPLQLLHTRNARAPLEKSAKNLTTVRAYPQTRQNARQSGLFLWIGSLAHDAPVATSLRSPAGAQSSGPKSGPGAAET